MSAGMNWFRGATREAGGRVEEKFGEAIGHTGMRRAGLYNQAAGHAQQMWGQVRSSPDELSSVIREQPLLASAIALGLGYLLGRYTS